MVFCASAQRGTHRKCLENAKERQRRQKATLVCPKVTSARH